ncbi:MAG: YchF family ATPase [Candidatus Colwellbacteria bacterium]|nr:YchF family ATPase [Candidatus Colwellbacteria bacterium]MDD3752427.1 YchF family ATPase [Candidatus Colwellbacteria bacterium]MDD4819001.1 YchF family ATPase [Candidatus Colwellbacteria bacterium]
MNLSIGIVGLPNVGKSTLFKMLTKKEVLVANYPFATIDPSVGVVPVPDERIKKLSEMSSSAKTIPAVVEFYDIAGLVKGASEGEGLGNQFLSHIRETDAVVQVVRCFTDENIIHVDDKGIDPERDIEIINMELIFKDLETINKRTGSLEKEARTGDKQKIKDIETFKELKTGLEKGLLARNVREGITDDPAVKELQLLTAKPQIYLLNGTEENVADSLKDKISKLNAGYTIYDLSSAEDLNKLIKKAYEILGLISFFTTGEDETRAWTVEKGSKAPQAAGAIHSDFEKKFIRAEVIGTEKLLEAGSWPEARKKGWIRLEGKEYVVEDGDVMVIRHG